MEIVDVDEVFEVGEPQLHHRDQAVPTGDEPGLTAQSLQKRVTDARCALIFERSRNLHESPQTEKFSTKSLRGGYDRVKRWSIAS